MTNKEPKKKDQPNKPKDNSNQTHSFIEGEKTTQDKDLDENNNLIDNDQFIEEKKTTQNKDSDENYSLIDDDQSVEEKKIAQNEDSNENDNDTQTQEDQDNPIPTEILNQLPSEERERLKLISIMGSFTKGNRNNSEITKKVTSQHIDKIINSYENENQREFELKKANEITKRWGMISVIVLVCMIFLYSGITKDKDLSVKVLTAGISALGGFGAGYAVGKSKQ